MAATNNIPNELLKRIERFRDCFFDKHKSSITKRLLDVRFHDMHAVLNNINNFIWRDTEEGYTYWYTLNLRWVIGVAYICHEFDKGYDNLCFKYLYEFINYRNSEAIKKENEEKYTQKRKFFCKKIKKLEKIFGN